MRRYLFTMPILTILLFACKKSEPTPPAPQYSINQGDSWLFQRQKSNVTDTTKLIALSPQIINNIQFYPIIDTTSPQDTDTSYLHASDSLLGRIPFSFGNQTYYAISRIIRASVNAGDKWVDTTVIKEDTIWIVVETTVDSTNLSISVPAGTFITTKVTQLYKYVHLNVTPPDGYLVETISWYINKDVLFPHIKVNIYYPSQDNFDLKLIKYQRAQIVSGL